MDKAKWMEENYQALQDKKLSELCLPGTHDSRPPDLPLFGNVRLSLA